MYDRNNKTSHIAMGNKYYDGIIFYLPQLCTAGSFMADRAVNSGVGVALDPYSDNFADSLYEYYQSIEFEEFFNCCDKELSVILNQVSDGEKKIKEVLDNANEQTKRK